MHSARCVTVENAGKPAEDTTVGDWIASWLDNVGAPRRIRAIPPAPALAGRWRRRPPYGRSNSAPSGPPT